MDNKPRWRNIPSVHKYPQSLSMSVWGYRLCGLLLSDPLHQLELITNIFKSQSAGCFLFRGKSGCSGPGSWSEQAAEAGDAADRHPWTMAAQGNWTGIDRCNGRSTDQVRKARTENRVRTPWTHTHTSAISGDAGDWNCHMAVPGMARTGFVGKLCDMVSSRFNLNLTLSQFCSRVHFRTAGTAASYKSTCYSSCRLLCLTRWKPKVSFCVIYQLLITIPV